MFVKNKSKIAVALSGGVDSSVTAALLKDTGYQVIGVYYKRGSKIIKEFFPDTPCPAQQDLEYIDKVAKQLSIPVEVYDFGEIYYKKIFKPLVEGYKKGITPNPDILCNRYIKFGELLKRVREELGVDYLATGHYARIFRRAPAFPWEGKFKVLSLWGAIDSAKDQNYFLGYIKKQSLRHITFPLGNLFKSEVRLLAEYYNLPTATRKASSGICFLGRVELRDFLQKILGIQKGKIIDIQTGKQVGEHNGAFLFTIGQRRGLNIGGLSTPYFVAKIDYRNNVVYVAKGRDSRFLLKSKVYGEDVNILLDLQALEDVKLFASVRYRQKYIPVRVSFEKEGARAIVETTSSKERFWGISPGQYINVVAAVSHKAFETRSPVSNVEEILRIFNRPNVSKNEEFLTGCTRCFINYLTAKIVDAE